MDDFLHAPASPETR